VNEMIKVNETINEEIRKIAEDENIPVLGIGRASKMANENPGYRPEDLLPGAQSLICYGIPIPYGAYRMPTYTAEMIWRSQNLYYRRLDTLSIRFAALLEESGVRAVPIYGCFPMGINNKGDVAGYLNQIRMGEVTGIGIIGKNGLLIHSRYGARLMLGGVVTTAFLPEMRYPNTEESGCPPDCRICVDACPVKAISIEKKRVNIMRCLGYTSRTPFMPKLKFLILRAFRPTSAARSMNLMAFDEHTFHVCSQCVALCPYGLVM
jgi:epoxyqueuosine reductase QueG